MAITYTQICEYCGKEYTPHRRTQKYCGHPCSSKASFERGITLKEKICEKCGVAYKPSNSMQTWCDACLTKPCQVCGKPFRMQSKSHEDRAKYCSVECRRIEFARKMKGKNAANYKSGQRMKTLEKSCEQCGKTYLVSPTHFEASKYCCRKCLDDYNSATRKGSGGPNWKGGISGLRERDMISREYKAWRAAVFEKDGYTCKDCGDATGGNLQAHHIKRYSNFPELRYSVSNGITLCVSCHRKRHKKKLDIQSDLS